MEPMLDAFREVVAQVTYAAPEMKLISTVTGKVAGVEIGQAEYWCKQIRETVRFADAISTLLSSNIDIFVEVGPQPVLTKLGRRCDPSETKVWLPSLQSHRQD